MQGFFHTYHSTLLGCLCGVLIALSFLFIGFLQTIFIVICVLLGGLIGWYVPQANWLVDLFSKNRK